jgi:hypothetical protein
MQLCAVDATERTANGVEPACRDVARDDRIGHSGKPAVPQMHVGPADLRAGSPQQRTAGGKIGALEPANFDWRVRGRHDGGEDAIAHGVR